MLNHGHGGMKNYRIHLVTANEDGTENTRYTYSWDYLADDPFHALDQFQADDDFNMNHHLGDILHMDVTNLDVYGMDHPSGED